MMFRAFLALALGASTLSAANPELTAVANARKALDAGQWQTAADEASKAAQLDDVSDYANWFRAQANYKLKNYSAAIASAQAVMDWDDPVSPFLSNAVELAAQASIDSGKPGDGVQLIRQYYAGLPQPQADLLLAKCLAASGDLTQAATYFQGVYYGFPNAKEAAGAATALADMKPKLGDKYPMPKPAQMLERSGKLFDSGNYAAARIELAAAINDLTGLERDIARVRLGVADYLANHAAAAFQYLIALKVDDTEADAERMAYLIRSTRALDRHADIKPYLDELAKSHAKSKWRLDALIFAADEARVDNDRKTFVPLYQSCASDFQSDSHASWCQWQIAFDAYRRGAVNEAIEGMKTELKLYSNGRYAENALYFLGRASETPDAAAAKAYYERLLAKFPNTYFAVLARERMRSIAAPPNTETVAFLDGLKWQSPAEFPSFDPSDTVQTRLDRSKMLAAAGLSDLSDNELKFGARNDGVQQNVYAFELAKRASAHGAPDDAMHAIRIYAPGYLFLPLDQAPVAFWALAFPFPYRATIKQDAAAQNLDPYFVAALIRQESEWNPTIVSHANAYGLMQIVPATGRILGRRAGIKRLRAAQLLDPTRNIQLGTMYIKDLLSSAGGEPEIALASYNAGPGRANLWKTWGPFHEPAEFVETVPFHETREYIQLVMRNADVYKRLYSGPVPDVPAYKPKPKPKPAPAKRHRRRK